MVARVRIRYARRGRMRFASHRDVARAFERALRRAGVPVAFSQGFSAHPRISYAGAAPTGVASEAEYLEIALSEPTDPQWVREALDAALPTGIDVLEAIEWRGSGSLGDLIEASRWRVELPGVALDQLVTAVEAFLRAEHVPVERVTKEGRRRFDCRAAVVSLETGELSTPPGAADGRRCAILDVVVRQATPSVRPDDVLAGLRAVANLEPPEPPRVTRLAQGRLTPQGEIIDPFLADEAIIGEPPR